MKKLTGFLMAFLLLAVTILAVAVCYLYQRYGAEHAAAPAFSQEPSRPGQSDDNATSETEAPEENGASRQEAEAKSEITGLRCSVQLGTLELVEGEAFGVSELSGNTCEAYIEDGVYVVTGSAAYENHLVVTVPAEYLFQSVELSVTGGALTAEGLHTNELTTNCDKGSIYYSGYLEETARVEQFQGKTTLELAGSEEDFNYELEYELGHIELGGEAYAGMHGDVPIDCGADKTIQVQCRMGSVSLLFLSVPDRKFPIQAAGKRKNTRMPGGLVPLDACVLL